MARAVMLLSFLCKFVARNIMHNNVNRPLPAWQQALNLIQMQHLFLPTNLKKVLLYFD